MATNKIQTGKVLSITLIAAAKSGDIVIQNKLVGVALTDGEIGETIAVEIGGVWELPKKAKETGAIGAYAYWHATNGIQNSNTGSAQKVGIFVETATDADDELTAFVRLNECI